MRKQAKWASPGLNAQSKPAVQKFSGRVLIAEDNETNRQVMITMLRNLGLQSAVAVNGNEAIAAVQRERFDLILMDYHMPELDGCDATIGIRICERDRAQARTPIVAVTASVLAEDRDKCLASGMDDFMAKPVRQRTLVGMLEKWLPPEARRAAHQSSLSSELVEPTWTTLPAELFDSEQLLEMRSIAGDSFDDLIAQFHGSAMDGLASIRNAIESGDAVAVKRAAHKLKGAAATLGAKVVAARCHALEVIGKEQRLEAAAEQLHCLEQEYLEVRRYMEACAQCKAAPAA
jgi:CheY-like chemotaxis protein/HPt (histidine-containing phosphotransfer) domain-containing protein